MSVSDDDKSELSFSILSLLATPFVFDNSTILFWEPNLDAENFLKGFYLLADIWGNFAIFYDSLRFMYVGVEETTVWFAEVYFFGFLVVPFSY